MTELEEFLEDLERKEADQDMHYSVYFIPKYYQEEGEDDAV